MATETLTRKICDRCKKNYKETALDAKLATPAAPPPPTMHLEMTVPLAEGDTAPVRKTLSFDDLCTKCHGRIADLVKAMTLTEKGETEVPPEKPPEKTDKPLDASAKPTDNKKSNDPPKVTTH